MAKNSKEQPKNTKKTPKIDQKKWPKYHLKQENYSLIGATGKTLSWFPKNIPKKTGKMAKMQ